MLRLLTVHYAKGVAHCARAEIAAAEAEQQRLFDALARVQVTRRIFSNKCTEPWGWMQPVRHALGALLLEQDRVDEAVAVYRADLGFDPTLSRAKQHPDNVWSLYGYVECLRRLGRQDELGSAQLRLELAAARADAGIAASCFCRVGRDCCG